MKLQVATLTLAAFGCLFAYKAWDDASMARKYSSIIPIDSLRENDNGLSEMKRELHDIKLHLAYLSENDNVGEMKRELHDIKLHLAYLGLTCHKNSDGTLDCKQE